MLHRYFALSPAKAPGCAFSQLCCCQPEDNACSEEPSIPADSQLTPGWTSAKRLLSHFHGLCSNVCCLCVHTVLPNGRMICRRAAGLAHSLLWKHIRQRDPLCRTNIVLFSVTAVSSHIDIVFCYFVCQNIISYVAFKYTKPCWFLVPSLLTAVLM